MSDNDAKMQVTRERMAYIRENHETLASLDPLFSKSSGVTQWGRIGGGSSGYISKPTQAEAIRRASLTEKQREDLAWFEVVYGAYLDLLQAPGRAPNKAVHDRLVAKVLKSYVFDGLTFERISESMGKTGRQYAYELYGEAVAAVRHKAQAAGLLKA